MIVPQSISGLHRRSADPTAFTITLTLPPKSKQSIGLALFALSATFAPAIGPTIGGYLTENFGWKYIFYATSYPAP